MALPPPEYRHITAAEAAQTLCVPRSTVRTWVARHRLYPVGIEADGTRRYRLADVLALAATRRARHLRDDRAVCDTQIS